MIRKLNTLFLLLLLIPYTVFSSEIEITKLKTEYADTPLGMDVKHPRFSWQMNVEDNARGYIQTAFQLIVQDESGQTVWNSEKVKSDIS